MGARKHETNQEKFTARMDVKPLNDNVTLSDLLFLSAAVIKTHTKSMIITKHGIDWTQYKPFIDNKHVGYIVRETCERCNKPIAPGQRKLRQVNTELGPVYMDTGICKDCINASIYVDKFLDGDILSETDAKKLYYKYAEEYEHQWRITLAAAPLILNTTDSWEHACKFFNGCAMCGGHIEVQHKYFPTSLNGQYTPWNIIPMCGDCSKKYKQVGRIHTPTKRPSKYRVFSTHTYFQKTKTIRLYLLAQMEFYGIYCENLMPYRQRFFEKKILRGSYPTNLPEELLLEAHTLAITEQHSMFELCKILTLAYQQLSLSEIKQYTDSLDHLLMLDSILKSTIVLNQIKEKYNGK